MAKAKSSSASVSVKKTKVASGSISAKQSKPRTAAIERDITLQQKKSASKKLIDQAGNAADGTANISAPQIGSSNSETAITAADANTAAAPSKPLLAATSTSAKSDSDRNQDRSLTGTPRAGSKLSIVLGMLREDGGASIAAIMQATGWLSHTSRAVLTGLKKRGYVIERQASEKDSISVYRIKVDATDGATLTASSSASKRAA